MRLVYFVDRYSSLLFLVAIAQTILSIFQIRYFIKVTDFIRELKSEIKGVSASGEGPAEQDPSEAAETERV